MRLVGRNLQRLVKMETQRRLLIIHQQINPQIRIETKSIAVKYYLQQDAVTDLNLFKRFGTSTICPVTGLSATASPAAGGMAEVIILSICNQSLGNGYHVFGSFGSRITVDDGTLVADRIANPGVSSDNT